MVWLKSVIKNKTFFGVGINKTVCFLVEAQTAGCYDINII